MPQTALAQLEFEQYLEDQVSAIAPECRSCIQFRKSSVVDNAGYCNHWEEHRRGCDRTCSQFSVKI